jgi:hypothetical protein
LSLLYKVYGLIKSVLIVCGYPPIETLNVRKVPAYIDFDKKSASMTTSTLARSELTIMIGYKIEPNFQTATRSIRLHKKCGKKKEKRICV